MDRRATYASAVPPPYPPVLQVAQPEDGGVAEHVLKLSLGLQERGWPVQAAVPPTSTIREPLKAAGVPVHDVPMTRAPGAGDLGAARRLRMIDRGEGFGIVHGHSSKAGALVRGALRRPGRLVYTPHCFPFLAEFDRLRKVVYTTAEQALVPRTGRIIGVCEWERERAREALRGVESRMDVVLNGVDGCPPGEAHPALVEWKGDLPLAAMIAVLRPQKDPLGLVRAAARLGGGDGEPVARVAIVGNGELAGAVEQEIRRCGVGDRVRLFPFEGDVTPYLKAIDLFVLPSAWEAMPFAVLEAMACGLPVLATDVGGVPEAVEHGATGELVPARHPAALGDALARMLVDPARLHALGRRGAEVVADRFGVDRMVDETAEIYERLLR
jgi:glycosyltransferase involved in cell wall biosynthesis